MPITPSRRFLPDRSTGSGNGGVPRVPTVPDSGGGSSSGGGSITVADSTNQYPNTSTIRFLAGTVTNLASEEADYTPPSISGPSGFITWTLTNNVWTGTFAAPLVPSEGGTGTANTGASGEILIGQGTAFAEKAVSGDASVTSSGVWENTGVLGLALPSLPSSLGHDWYLKYNGSAFEWVQLKPPYIGYAEVVATSNVTLSGLQTIDGVLQTDGTVTLCVGQTTGSQNGPWVAHSGAWTRPTWYYSGSTVSYGTLITVLKGGSTSQYAYSTWEMTSSLPAKVVDTDATAWSQSEANFNGGVIGTLSVPNGGTGANTLTNHGVLLGQGTNAVSATAAGTAGQVLRSGGASSDPAWNDSPVHGIPTWSNADTYKLGDIVIGSDNNQYRSLVNSNTNNDPTLDAGTNFELYYLRASITLNCGSGQRFAGSASDPSGITQAFTFIQNANGASPANAVVTIQVANNPTGTASGGTSTTSFTTATNVPVGAVLMFTSGTAGNVGKSCYVSGTSGSGPYTLTVDSTHGTSGLSSAPVNADGFTYTYAPTGTITINAPNIGANLKISGSTSTVSVASFYPSISTATSGGSIVNNTYYCAVTYTWVDASGTTRETLAGPVTSQVTTGSNLSTLTCATFTLPTGVTGANFYVGTTTGASAVLHKQAAFSISGGSASALTITSYNSSGAAAPSTNPNAAAYPVSLTFGGVLGINVINSRGTIITGLFMRGDGTTNKAGLQFQNTSFVTLTAPMVLSTWGDSAAGGAIITTGISRVLGNATGNSSIQCDNSGIGAFGFQQTLVQCSNIVCLYCVKGSYCSQTANGVLTNSYMGFSTTGYFGDHTGNMQTAATNPAAGTAQPTYGCTTPSNPTFNTVGNQNSYIANN